MRFHFRALAAAGALAVGTIASAQDYHVRTMAAPNVTLTTLHSFHLLPTPRRLDGVRKSGAYDPMVSNSIANRALRATVSGEFEMLGYCDTEWLPEFFVAIYATTRERLDFAKWEFGYHYSPQWWSMPVPDQTATPRTEGTLIVDVVNPETLDVLWRGYATIPLDHDPLENAKELVKAATAIIDKFPRARPIVVAAMR
jgi:hypothetical protein